MIVQNTRRRSRRIARSFGQVRVTVSRIAQKTREKRMRQTTTSHGPIGASRMK